MRELQYIISNTNNTPHLHIFVTYQLSCVVICYTDLRLNKFIESNLKRWDVILIHLILVNAYAYLNITTDNIKLNNLVWIIGMAKTNLDL